MPLRTRKSLLASCGMAMVLSAILLVPRSARAAEQGIIRIPGDHPKYVVELEPHVLAAFIAPFAGNGFGLGMRAAIPLMDNGFVPTINNNVAIGFGADWIHYHNCWRGYPYRGYPYDCPSIDQIYFPVVLQWNFFLSTHFSVFGELGTGFRYTSWPDQYCGYWNGNRWVYDVWCGPNSSGGGSFDWDPLILAVGGRFHFSDKVALTGRLGYPYFSFGVSFLL